MTIKTHPSTKLTVFVSLILLIVLDFPGTTEAQTFAGFNVQSTISTATSGTNPVSIVSGDFNGDNRIDLLVANTFSTSSSSQGSISILRGNGNGTFQLQSTLLTGNRPSSVAVGDFNGNGRLDFAVTNLLSRNIMIYRGNGNLTFTLVQTIPISTDPNDQPTLMRTHDVDGDGKIDIVAFVRNKFRVFKGVGTGLFQEDVTIDAEFNVNYFIILDINKDEFPDIVATSETGQTIAFYLGQSMGTFQPSVTLPVNGQPRGLASNDLTANGNNDLVVAIQNSSTFDTLLLLPGSGMFNPPPTSFQTSGSNPRTVHLADMNGDGVLDVLTIYATSDNLIVTLGVATESLGNEFSQIVGDQPFDFTIADFTNDGVADVAVLNNLSNNITILKNLTVPVAPSVFTLISPANGATGLPLPEVLASWPGIFADALLHWSPSSGVGVTYTVEISLDSSFNNIIISTAGVSDTSFPIPLGALSPATTYYWRVTAVNSSGTRLSSPLRHAFTTANTADINGDGFVNGLDLTILLNAWSG